MYFLQFQWDCTPQVKLEEAFVYKLDKPIYIIHINLRLRILGYKVRVLKQIKEVSSKLELSPCAKFHLLIHSELADRK